MAENKRQILLKEIGIEKTANEIEEYEWARISAISDLSEEFIREFQEELYWENISKYQKISGDWWISTKVTLSEKFIEEFKERIYWEIYFKENYAKYEIIKKYILRTGIKHTGEFNSFHLNEIQKSEIDKLLKLKNMF